MAKKSPVVIVRRNGKQFLRSRPLRVKQNSATRQSAKVFGTLSSLASQLVHSFAPLIGTTKGEDVYKRLFSVLKHWAQEQVTDPITNSSYRYFEGFRFVQKAGIESRFRVAYQVKWEESGQVVIALGSFVPAEQILAPTGCTKVSLKLAVASCSPYTGAVLAVNRASLDFDFDIRPVPASQVILPIQTGEGALHLLAMSLQYDNIVAQPHPRAADLGWMPGGIIASRYQQP